MSAENVDGHHVGLLPPPSSAHRLYAESDPSSEAKMFSAESLTQSESEDDQEEEGFCDCAPATNFCSVMAALKDEEAPHGCFGPLRSLGPKLPVVVSSSVEEDPQWPAGMAQEPPPVSPPRGGTGLPHYNFEVPNRSSSSSSSSSVARVSIQNVQITGTSTAKEQRGSSTHPYTLYTVKVPASSPWPHPTFPSC